jgi:hypothetical protein
MISDLTLNKEVRQRVGKGMYADLETDFHLGKRSKKGAVHGRRSEIVHSLVNHLG